MGRMYSVSFAGTITAADGVTDLVEIDPGAEKPCRLVGYVIGQSSEVAEAQEEGIEIDVIILPSATGGSGGSAGNEEPLDGNDTAAGFVSEVLNDVPATTGGTARTLDSCAWNNRASPLERWWPDERLRPRVQAADFMVIRWQTTVADDTVVRGTAYIEEL